MGGDMRGEQWQVGWGTCGPPVSLQSWGKEVGQAQVVLGKDVQQARTILGTHSLRTGIGCLEHFVKNDSEASSMLYETVFYDPFARQGMGMGVEGCLN